MTAPPALGAARHAPNNDHLTSFFRPVPAGSAGTRQVLPLRLGGDPAKRWHGPCPEPGETAARDWGGCRRQNLTRIAQALAKILTALAVAVCFLAPPATAQIRIKDIVDMEGVRDNQLVGYGLVIGLNGTGDRLRSSVFTRQSLVGMLERLGINSRDFERQLDTKNVAAVMVTANLPAFAKPGSRIDVAVSALGDATNLTGGTLLVTPLLGADGEVYAGRNGAG